MEKLRRCLLHKICVVNMKVACLPARYFYYPVPPSEKREGGVDGRFSQTISTWYTFRPKHCSVLYENLLSGKGKQSRAYWTNVIVGLRTHWSSVIRPNKVIYSSIPPAVHECSYLLLCDSGPWTCTNIPFSLRSLSSYPSLAIIIPGQLPWKQKLS